MIKFYPILPVPKPRMTRQDKWKKRGCVMQYRAFADEVRARGVRLPEAYHVVFILPMPKSWPKKKRVEMCGKPHQQTPDKDNMEKALLDALYGNDAHVWDGRCSKIWGRTGGLVVGSCIDSNSVFTAANEFSEG